MTPPLVVPWLERRGTGRPVVLLHGLADDHGLWRHVVPGLDGVETIVVDLPGHGASPPIPEGATIGWMAACVAAALREADVERAVIVGLSMGGGVAQTLAIDHPELVESLVLVSTSPVFPPATRERFLTRAAVAERDGMAAVVDATVPRWFTPAWMAAHPDEVERTKDTVLATDPVSFARASRLNAVRDVLERLPEIQVPVLFVGGVDDPADPARAAGQYRERLQEVRIELLPDASHLVPVEAPDRFLPILHDFLGALPSPDPSSITARQTSR